jgi:hypothetical protein
MGINPAISITYGIFVRTFSAFALLSDIPLKVLPMRLFFTLSQLIIRILTPVSICNLMGQCDSQWCKKSYRAAQTTTGISKNNIVLQGACAACSSFPVSSSGWRITWN